MKGWLSFPDIKTDPWKENGNHEKESYYVDQFRYKTG